MKRILLLFGVLMCGISNAQLTAPFTESFDNTTIPTGWANTSTNAGANANWKFAGTPGNPSMATSPLYVPAVTLDHTGNAGSYAWSDGSTPAVADCGLMTDSIDISSLTNLFLEFWIYSNNVFDQSLGNNTMTVNFYDGTTWNNAVWTYSASASTWQYIGLDLSSYTTSGKVLFEFVLDQTTMTNAFYNDYILDDISVKDAPPCPLPLGQPASNITATTADANWTVGTSASTWTVLWGAGGYDPSIAGGLSASATASPYTISSLTGNTVYDYYIIADCGTNGVSDTAGPFTFRTACVPEVLGYSNNFDSDPAGATPLCWTEYLSSINGGTDVINFATPNSGTNHVEISNGFAASTDTIMLISTEFVGLSSGNNQLRFFSKASSAAVELIIGTVSSSASPQSFVAMDTLRYSTANTYEEFIYAFTTANGYNGTDNFIAFKHGNTQTFTEAYIDDVNYEAIPPCPQVTGVSILSTGSDSVVVAYTSSGSTVGYEWGPVGFAQGTGTVGTSNGNPLVVTGLASATSYDIYIQNDCSGNGNGTSVWVGPFTFQTTCLVQALPFTEDFNFGTGCATLINIGATSVGWEHQPIGGSNKFGDLDGTPYMIADSDFHANGIHMIADMETPPIDAGSLSTGASLIVEWDQFFFAINAGDSASVQVFDGTSWVNVYSTQANIGAFGSPDHQFIDITAYANAALKVRFHYDDNDVWAWYWAVDNITVREISCLEPTNLGLISRTSSSAIIGWNAGGGALATNVEYGITGFTQGSGSTQLTNGASDTLNGLLSNTTYDVYVQDSCGSTGGNSIWVGPFTFTTRCVISPATLPLNDGFESYAVGPYQTATDFCNPTYIWEYSPTVTEGRLRVAAGIGFSNTGNQAATLDNSVFISPATTNYLTLNVDLSSYTTAPGIELSFSILNIAQEANPDNRVWVRGGNSDPWIEIVNLDLTTTSGSFVNINNIDIVGPLANAGQTVGSETQIRWGQSGVSQAFNTSFSDGYSIDDVVLSQVTCPTPSGLTISNLSDTSGYLNWNGSAFASDYEVWFGPIGFFQGSTTAGGVTGTTGGADSLLVDTLSPNTCYEYLVRYICGPGDSSLWAGPFSFCTPCSPFFAPYFENFDAQITNQVPSCWSSLVEGPGTPFAGSTVIGFNSFSPANALELDNWTGGNTVIAYSPLLGDLDVGDKRVSFWSRHGFTATNVIVGTSDNPSSSLNFNPIDTIPLTANYAEYVVNLTTADGYNGTDKFIGLMHSQTNTFTQVLIDDFIYEVIPTCPKPPSMSITTQIIGTTTAELEWDAGTAGNLNFEISYGPAITAPNQGVTSIVSGDSALLNSLMANTQYCFFVREICGPGDTSTWSLSPSCFTTLCTPFTAPYFQDFESPNTAVGHWDGPADCWDYVSNNPGTNGSGGYSWEVRNTAQTTSGTGTGPDRDNTLAPAVGGKFITADVSGSSTAGPDSTILSSPSIDISGLLTPEFEFYYHMHGTNMADLHVDIWNGSSWDRDEIVILGTQNISQADPYNDTIYDLTAYAGQTDLRVRFRALTNGCCSGDIAIDDIRISDPVSCTKPANLSSTNITGSGAKLLWDSGSATVNGNYEVSLGVNIAMPSAGVVSPVIGDSLVLSNLTDATLYCYYVREICGPGDTSAWTGPHCFQTLCLLQTLPYSENFNLNEGCMSLLNVGFTAVGWEPQPAGGANQFGDLDGTGYMIADSDAHANGIHMIVDMESPIIDASVIAPGKILAVEWDQYFNSILAGDSGTVQVYDGSNWITVWSNQNDLGAFGAPDHPVVDVTAYANAAFQVRFRYDDNNVWAWYWAVDNVLVSERTPNCDPPVNITTTQIDCNQIEFTWTSNTGGSIIEYGPTGFTPGTGTYTGIVTSPTFVTALSPSTSYDFYFADTCSGGDTSSFAGPFFEATIACPVGCIDPTGLDTASSACTSAILQWVSGPTAIGSAVEWGPAGFAPGTGAGTIVANATNPLPISGLTAGAGYDFYVVDFCATDTSNVTGPMSFTTRTGPITAAFTATPGSPTLTNMVVTVDALNSVGATTYTWDWGDGTPTSTVSSNSTFHSYSANGGYNIKLIITGDCGVDSISQVVNVAGISIAENALGRSMQLYPNPTVGLMNLSFDSESNSAVISVLDLTGKTIMQIEESNLIGGEYEGQLDISHLAKGTYVLKVESGDLSVQRRIIKR